MQSNKTIKYTDVIVKNIKVENLKLGKDEVPMIRYEDGPLLIQGPKIKLSSYGLPPGETLGNGSKNDYYISEEARDSIKIPLDTESSNVDGNNEEISEFINLLKAIDTHIKSSSVIKSVAGIDEEDTEKYNTIYRKPKSIKKKDSKPQKEKLPYMKVKLNVNYNDKSQILTEFYDISDDKKGVRVLTDDTYVTIKDLEKHLVYNTEVQPVIQLVKVWTQSTGAWGVTLKLLKLRFKKPARTAKVVADFIDDDDNVKQVTKAIEVAEVSSSDDEVVIKKPAPKKIEKSDSEEDVKPKKVIKKVESDSDGSDSEEDIKPVKVTKKVPVKSVKK
jgi:hypothetical protein